MKLFSLLIGITAPHGIPSLEEEPDITFISTEKNNLKHKKVLTFKKKPTFIEIYKLKKGNNWHYCKE